METKALARCTHRAIVPDDFAGRSSAVCPACGDVVTAEGAGLASTRAGVNFAVEPAGPAATAATCREMGVEIDPADILPGPERTSEPEPGFTGPWEGQTS